MKVLKTLRNMALAAMLLSAGAANAALYQFQITGDYTANWTLDSEREPDDAANGEALAFIDVEGSFPGSLLDLADIYFFNEGIGGGLQIEDFFGGSFLLTTDGPQLYTGLETGHDFRLGTFALTEYEGTGNYELTISALPSDVPEPATAAMLLGGLGMLYAVRRRCSVGSGRVCGRAGRRQPCGFTGRGGVATAGPPWVPR